jgi:hypothetical protein
MASYEVFIRQEFAGWKTIEATTEEEARDLAWSMLNTGEIDPFSDFECDTNVDEIELTSAKIYQFKQTTK